MNPDNIPFNVLVVGPTNSGKSQFAVDQLYSAFRDKFDYIVLICPTFAHNKTFRRLGEKDPRMVIVICEQHEVELWLMVARYLFEGTNTLHRPGRLRGLERRERPHGRDGESRFFGALHGRHMGASFWENVAAVVLFYTPVAKTIKSIFEDFAGELTSEEYKALIARLKKQKYSLRHPFGVELFPKGLRHSARPSLDAY